MDDFSVLSDNVFDDANVIDCIRQSYIDLDSCNDRNSVKILLTNAIQYLKNESSENILNELVSLIPECFSRFPSDMLPLFNDLYKLQKKPYTIITIASVISYYVNNEPTLNIGDYSSFVDEALREIHSQIEHPNELNIFGKKIPFQHQIDVIINFILCAQLTKQLITDYMPFLISKRISNNPRFPMLITKISKAGLITTFPISILSDQSFFKHLSSDDIRSFMHSISDQLFIQIFPQIEETFNESENLSSSFVKDLILKCNNLNLKLRKIQKAFNFLSSSDFDHHICEYISQFDFIISEENVKRCIDMPDADLLLKILPEVKDPETIVHILKAKIGDKSADPSSSDFYVKLYSLFRQIECPLKLIQMISVAFKKFVPAQKSNDIINDMIFSSYPPNRQHTAFLTSFVKLLDDKHSSSFYSPDFMKKLISAILDRGATPRLEFVELISKEAAIEVQHQREKEENPLLLYLAAFSKSHSKKPVKKPLTNITVLPPKSPSDEKLIKFIQTSNYELIHELEKEPLSLASAAVIFADSDEKVTVNGLTKESVLQFYSIAALRTVMQEKEKLLDSISPDEMKAMLLDALDTLGSKYDEAVIASINSILLPLEQHLIFSDQIRSQILNTLSKYLLNDTYKADCVILIMRLLQNAGSDQMKWIEFIATHPTYFNFTLIQEKVNLNDLDSEKVGKLFESCFDNKDLEPRDVLSIIYFIQNICVGLSNLKITKAAALLQSIDEIADDKKWEDALTVARFMEEHGISNELAEKVRNNDKIPPEIKVKMIPYNCMNEDELISAFLASECPETDAKLHEALYKKMLTDQSNVRGHLQMIFECLEKPTISPAKILVKYYDEYKSYGDEFIKVLDNVIVLHPDKKIFVPQAVYKQFDYPSSEFNNKIINRLFDIVRKNPDNYQAFYCLECIACNFPFLFASDPEKVFELVLPAFDFYQVIFEKMTDDKEEERKKVQKGKASIAASSFLIYCLNSTKFADLLFEYFFSNYEKFTLSQLLCFIITFLRMKTKNTIGVAATEMRKYKLYDVFNKILMRDVPSNLFGENFNSYLYFLLTIQSSPHEILGIISTILMKDYFQHKNLFSYSSENSITNYEERCLRPMKTDLIYLDSDENKALLNQEPFIFIKANKSNLKPSWIAKYRKDNKITNDQIDEFIEHYYSLIEKHTADNSSLRELPDDINVKVGRFIMLSGRWQSGYILSSVKKFPLLCEHHKILEQLIDDIHKYPRSSDDSIDEILLEDFSCKKYYANDPPGRDFMLSLISRIDKTYALPFSRLIKLLKNMKYETSDYEYIFSLVHKKIKHFLNDFYYFDEEAIKSLCKCIQIFTYFNKSQVESNDVDTSDYRILFFEEVGDDLIEVFLRPQYRMNPELLKYVYRLLIVFKKYPSKVLHTIWFMLLTNNDFLLRNAPKLCLRFEDEELEKFSILDDVFSNELASDHPRIDIIFYILKAYQPIGNSHRVELQEFLNTELSLYKKGLEAGKIDPDKEIDSDDVELMDIIIELLDFLCPTRKSNKSFGLTDSLLVKSKDIDPQFRFHPIPDFIYQTSPRFWRIFEDYRTIINNTLLKKYKTKKMIEPTSFLQALLASLISQFSSKLVCNFPECFSFDFRSTFFHQEMHDALVFHRGSEVRIDQNKVFECSYEQLNKKTDDEWKERIIITYNNEEGIDAGGLLRDWFTKISKEIFNPESELFEASSKNESYSPRRSMEAKTKESLKKYEFIGRIIARALMQGNLLTTHFNRSFLKHILHHEDSLKFEDLEDEDEQLFTSLKYIKEHPMDFEQYFEQGIESGQTVELKPNGSKIKVTDENKDEFIYLSYMYRLHESIKEQCEAFSRGFDSLIPHENIRLFTANELNLLICGVPKIDVDDMMKNVEYGDGYDADSPAVKLFFETIKKWDNENLAKLIIFITGTSRMPASGFSFFKMQGTPIRIAPLSDTKMLPTAHTCSNTIDLPNYGDEDEMNEKLLIAINCDNFLLK